MVMGKIGAGYDDGVRILSDNFGELFCQKLKGLARRDADQYRHDGEVLENGLEKRELHFERMFLFKSRGRRGNVCFFVDKRPGNGAVDPDIAEGRPHFPFGQDRGSRKSRVVSGTDEDHVLDFFPCKLVVGIGGDPAGKLIPAWGAISAIRSPAWVVVFAVAGRSRPPRRARPCQPDKTVLPPTVPLPYRRGQE